MPATTGMKGAGYYDQHSTAQLSAIQAIQDWVDDAGAYTGFLRAVSEPVVRAALNGPNGEVEAVECLYERIQGRLFAEPERYSYRYLLVAASLTRR
jgi:hypothetical protein